MDSGVTSDGGPSHHRITRSFCNPFFQWFHNGGGVVDAL
ncbi:hypothetical protein A2U01_0008195 [Trifolium medium]|uniref:Uncharacterized protein n=1 Tax=Trifolium medium TaxID=97028 RepID=A0A392MIL2_9FABA|nr:hypothetical protein [Trifolium medium]